MAPEEENKGVVTSPSAPVYLQANTKVDSAKEDPFDLIKKGNAFESSSNQWRAADCYSRASVALRYRADAISARLRQRDENSTRQSDEEQKKVVSLYRHQSLEYFYKGRHCLLEALVFENEQDRSRTLTTAKEGSGSLDPLCSMIQVEESKRRRMTFGHLFLGNDENSDYPAKRSEDNAQKSTERIEISYATASTQTSEEKTQALTVTNDLSRVQPAEEVEGRQHAIESRLADLNSSLSKPNLPEAPPSFISGSRKSKASNTQERLDEIHRGLGRLGLTLPDNQWKKSELIMENISEEDQVKLIIQHARDEALIEKGLHTETSDNMDGISISEVDDGDTIDENDSMFDGFEDEEDNLDVLLAKAEKLTNKESKEANGKATSSVHSEIEQVRKAQSLLLESRLYLEMEHAHSSVYQKGVSVDPEKLGEDNNSENTVKSADSTKDERENTSDRSKRLATRNKAHKRISEAQSCLKGILQNWK